MSRRWAFVCPHYLLALIMVKLLDSQSDHLQIPVTLAGPDLGNGHVRRHSTSQRMVELSARDGPFRVQPFEGLTNSIRKYRPGRRLGARYRRRKTTRTVPPRRRRTPLFPAPDSAARRRGAPDEDPTQPSRAELMRERSLHQLTPPSLQPSPPPPPDPPPIRMHRRLAFLVLPLPIP